MGLLIMKFEAGCLIGHLLLSSNAMKHGLGTEFSF